jgi:hypothetical protein
MLEDAGQPGTGHAVGEERQCQRGELPADHTPRGLEQEHDLHVVERGVVGSA